MTDLEMTRLCAEAMNYETFVADGWLRSRKIKGKLIRKGLEYLFEHNGAVYDPLHDDEQAMALLKKFRPSIEPLEDGSWFADMFGGEYAEATDLNRAIVECAAKMQADRR